MLIRWFDDEHGVESIPATPPGCTRCPPNDRSDPGQDHSGSGREGSPPQRRLARRHAEIDRREEEGAKPSRARSSASSGRSGLNLVIVESPAKPDDREVPRPRLRSAGLERHVRDLPKSKLGVDVEAGFAPSYVLIKGKGNIVKDLKASARRVG